ncbi:MAG: DUF61 family protein [Methanoregulaceae archaeon]|nr:DUF61 family protein [Methanoregulaceae archaeon]
MALEMGRINDGVVVERPRLFSIITSDRPVAITRGGKEYRFNAAVLRKLDEKLPPGIKEALKVPIIFYFDSNVADSCFLTDGVALESLQVLGELSRMRTMNEGKLWVGRAIVYSLMRKYPSVIQIMMR